MAIFERMRSARNNTNSILIILTFLLPLGFKSIGNSLAINAFPEFKTIIYNVSQKWLKSYHSHVSDNYHTKLGKAIENYISPSIKNKAIDEITRLEIISIMEELKEKELLETARRTVMLLNKILSGSILMFVATLTNLTSFVIKLNIRLKKPATQSGGNTVF